MAKSQRHAGHQDVDHQHAELNQLVHTIRSVLGERSAAVPEVERLLRNFAVAANRHFEFEEEGGYFSDAVAQAPRLSRRAAELQQEHVEMSQMLQEMLEMAHGEAKDGQWWEELSRRFVAFAKRMDAHEAAEVRLLQEAYIDDIGAED